MNHMLLKTAISCNVIIACYDSNLFQGYYIDYLRYCFFLV